MSVQIRLFGDISHAPFESQQVLLDGDAIEEDLAGAHLHEPGDHLHGCRFTRSVRSQVTGNLSGLRREADVIHGDSAGESLSDVSKFEHNISIPALLLWGGPPG